MLFFHFVWSPTSFAPKTHYFHGEDLFLVLVFTPFGPKIHYFYGEDLFFGLHLFLDRKRVTPQNPATCPTILSSAIENNTRQSTQQIQEIIFNDFFAVVYYKPTFQTEE